MNRLRPLCIAILSWCIGSTECAMQKTLFDFFPGTQGLTIEQLPDSLDAWESESFVSGYPNAQRIIKTVLEFYDRVGFQSGLPHLAILRTTDQSNQVAECNLLFLSGVNVNNSVERVVQKIFEIERVKFSENDQQTLAKNCYTIGAAGYSVASPLDTAHSEVAIGLYLKSMRTRYKIIQIKNAWDMCQNCKNFWTGRVKISRRKCIGGTNGSEFLPQNNFGKFHLRVHVKGQNSILGY